MPSAVRFGPFVFDQSACRLTRDDVDLGVSPRHLDVLACLVRKPAALVSKEELIEAGWPDVAVSDNSLTQVISELRRALDDSPASPLYIQTVARRGYRFIAAIEPVGDAAAAPVAPLAPDERSRRARETSSLEAARALSEGRWRLEALDASLIPAAIAEFEHAIALDPSYAAAYLGLANALFWQVEASRHRGSADGETLARAVDAARRAVALEPELAEAHASLGYVLAGAGLSDEALKAASRAVALEPGYWAHHFRLGHASWGEARLRAHARALELYPDFAFAHLETAMVFAARNDLAAAEAALRQGLIVHERHRGRAERFPARGLDWLLGLVLHARGDAVGALAAFDREIDPDSQRLYALEFSANALYARGVVQLTGGAAAEAERAFAAAQALHVADPRPYIGRAEALRALGRDTDAMTCTAAATQVIAALERAGRRSEARAWRRDRVGLSWRARRGVPIAGRRDRTRAKRIVRLEFCRWSRRWCRCAARPGSTASSPGSPNARVRGAGGSGSRGSEVQRSGGSEVQRGHPSRGLREGAGSEFPAP